MAHEREGQRQADGLRQELYGLARVERELRREIGTRVIAGQPVVDLCALRRANRESQENLAAAVNVLEAGSWPSNR